MALLSHLDAFCNWLCTRVRAHVSVGRPDKALTGIYFWPSYAVPNLQKRNMPRMPDLEETVGGLEAQTFDINFLLLATPADTVEALASLEAAQQAIHDNPILILNAAGAQLKVIPEQVPNGDLAAIFTAARLELTICLAYVLR
jgi:hypothetical protein